MNVSEKRLEQQIESLPTYDSILMALDSSDHSNQALKDSVSLARLWNAELTGSHVYAAKMHDARFRQMEGGLPEQYREEDELERQRDVHDDLITRGLSIITESHLDQADETCRTAGLGFERLSLEGKNYRGLVREANSGKFDLIVLGALGLGAVDGNRLGTVCLRTARRSNIDTLVIKEPGRALREGPIVVGVDGSGQSYGGLLSALALAAEWDVPVHVVAAYDPYYHYVAFNKIAGILSEAAGEVFKFEEQEKLHEEIIDSGLAKIYESHLTIASSIAEEFGAHIETELLDGKPHHAIEKYVAKHSPSLLVVGKCGIHADPDLDIGGNTEVMLRNVDCAVLISSRRYKPRVDVIAEATTSWTNEAEERLLIAPAFVQPMARLAILRYAQEHGHTVITARIVEEATSLLMPGRSGGTETKSATPAAGDSGTGRSFGEIPWSEEAAQLRQLVEPESLRENLSRRAEKKARTEGSAAVEARHIEAFLATDKGQGQSASGQEEGTSGTATSDETAPEWTAAALARLARVPEGFMRDATKQRIENYADQAAVSVITFEVAEDGIADSRAAMEAEMATEGVARDNGSDTSTGGKCPFDGQAESADTPAASPKIKWSRDARLRLQKVPAGFCRAMTKRAAETLALQAGAEKIDRQLIEEVFTTFEAGSTAIDCTMEWTPEAQARIKKAPDTVRGMLVGEIEGWARRHGLELVDGTAVEAVKNEWQNRGVFHLEPGDPRNS